MKRLAVKMVLSVKEKNTVCAGKHYFCRNKCTVFS